MEGAHRRAGHAARGGALNTAEETRHGALQLLPLVGLVPGAHRAGAEGPGLRLQGRCTWPRTSNSPSPTPRCRRRGWCRCCATATRRSRSRWRSSSTSTRPTRSRRCCRPTRWGARGCARWRMDIACEIHPLNNLRVLRYLVHDLKLSRGRQGPLVPPLGRDRSGGRWSASSPRSRRASAMATRRPWPTACWCRRSSTPSASNAALDHVPQVMRVFDACMQLRRLREDPARSLPGCAAERCRADARPAGCGRHWHVPAVSAR